MQAPDAAELLGAWERSARLGPAEREDVLLRLALPDDDPAGLPVGERNARLLELRELLFGDELDGAADCADCGETVEYSLDTGSLLAGRPVSEALELTALGRRFTVRLPTGADLAGAASVGDLEGARTLLLERCVGERVAAALPADVVAELSERLARLDPLADAQLALTCPACGCRWTVALESGAWLWSEVDSWARRTLFDVHALASAYGWSEAEILALGPRRELYLELVEG
jgi:hypothetical protein